MKIKKILIVWISPLLFVVCSWPVGWSLKSNHSHMLTHGDHSEHETKKKCISKEIIEIFPISAKQTHSSSLIGVDELYIYDTNFSSFLAHDQKVSSFSLVYLIPVNFWSQNHGMSPAKNSNLNQPQSNLSNS